MKLRKAKIGMGHYNIIILFSYASEHSCSLSSGGQGMGKIGEDSGVKPDESQKQERGDR